jgi:hypothetical protein
LKQEIDFEIYYTYCLNAKENGNAKISKGVVHLKGGNNCFPFLFSNKGDLNFNYYIPANQKVEGEHEYALIGKYYGRSKIFF